MRGAASKAFGAIDDEFNTDPEDLTLVAIVWPGGFKFGQAVWDTRTDPHKAAYVMPGNLDNVPYGHVPILYAYGETDHDPCFARIPAQDLIRRLPS